MDGMLSQDEINALLTGMDLSADTSAQEPESVAEIDESLLTPDERDAIGEIANISMGSSATTLYSLVNKKVDISTPVVQIANWEMVVDAYERPCVFIQINYTAGLDGSNTMILKEHDVKVITDLMMGGTSFECDFRGNESDDGLSGNLNVHHAWQDDRYQPPRCKSDRLK